MKHEHKFYPVEIFDEVAIFVCECGKLKEVKIYE